jgi:hypothetical protein
MNLDLFKVISNSDKRLKPLGLLHIPTIYVRVEFERKPTKVFPCPILESLKGRLSRL